MRTGASALALDLLSAACPGPQQPARRPTARTAIDARTLGANATGVARRLRLAAPARVALCVDALRLLLGVLNAQEGGAKATLCLSSQVRQYI